MCNVEEDGERAPVARGMKPRNKCVKCDQQGIVVTRIHDSFCKECFRVYIVHRFRSAIGKSKLIREGEKVLVAFSGGASSAAVLHLITDGLSQRAHKKLRFIPTLLHVDEFSVLENSSYNRLEIQQKISQLMLQSGFPAYITSLEQGLHSHSYSDQGPCGEASDCKDNVDPVCWEASEDIEMLQDPSESYVKRLKDILAGLSSLTCKEDFLRNLRNQLIVRVARKLGFSKVITAESSSRLSVRILTNIAQGRGSQVYLDTGFSDSRNDDVMFIRPIRDLTSKEVVMYNCLFDVASIFLPTLTTKATIGASIERLTESFVTGLQADFPSTTSNIVRTSEKLSQSCEEGSMKCSFCKSALDTNVPCASALNAILFSKKLSNSGKNCKTTDDPLTEEADLKTGKESSSGTDVTTMSDVMPHLCFGCRLSIQDYSGELDSLPFVQEKSRKSVDSLKNQIADFLLDDTAS